MSAFGANLPNRPVRGGWVAPIIAPLRRGRMHEVWIGVAAGTLPVQFFEGYGIVQVVVEAAAQCPLLQQALQ